VLSYRHAFHAGNFADVLKHTVLVALVQALQRKPAPFFALDTHAGAGVYDLDATPASSRREHDGGIGQLWGHSGACPPAVAAWLEEVRALNAPGAARARYYPGSPAILRGLLREDDRLVCSELHSSDFPALEATFASDPRVEVRHADGYATMAAVLPPRERRGLVLVDPAYERKDEIERLLAALDAARARFGHGVFVVWYPVASRVPVAELHAGIAASGARKVLRVELCVRRDDDPQGLNGSGLIVVNPPFRMDETLRELLAWLHPRLAPDGGGRIRLDWLVPE
jgi:23S rRNA (adenine2030-N6)-methyltransferase